MDKLCRECVNKSLATYSISQTKKVCAYLSYNTKEEKVAFLNDEISTIRLYNLGLERYNNSQDNNNRSFETIYAEMRDVNNICKMTLTDTASLFSMAVDNLEEVIGRIISDEYIDTFSEDNLWAKKTISETCNRLEQVINVISSLNR